LGDVGGNTNDLRLCIFCCNAPDHISDLDWEAVELWERVWIDEQARARDSVWGVGCRGHVD
jgi:hypothetical protein